MFAEQNEKRLKRRALAGGALQLLFVASVLSLIVFIVVTSLRSGAAFAAAAIAAMYFWYVIRTLRIYAGMRPRVVPYFELKYFRSDDPLRKTAEEVPPRSVPVPASPLIFLGSTTWPTNSALRRSPTLASATIC